MKTTWKTEWPQWMLLAAMFGLAAWRWPLTGDKMPVHWGLNGHVDRYGGKIEGLLFLPLLSLGLYAMLWGLPRLDPGRANYAQFAKSYTLIRFLTLALNFVIYAAVLGAAAGFKIEIASVIWPASGVLFIGLGNAMGKLRPNWFSGIRTPWTLSSKTAWVKTHRVGGWTFIALGAAQIVLGLALPPAPAFLLIMALIMVSTSALIAYSYFAWRDADDKTPPAGTLPAE